MSKKYLIFGATGAIGSSLASQFYDDNENCHLVARNEEEVKKLSSRLVSTLSRLSHFQKVSEYVR